MKAVSVYMATVLLGWELGGNYGHVNQLKALSKRLIQDGHTGDGGDGTGKNMLGVALMTTRSWIRA